MQEYVSLVATTLIISPSGALSPGPLTIACIAEGARTGWKAGVKASLGHMAVEVPYTLALVLLASRVVLEPSVYKLMSILSAGAMVFFSYLIVRDAGAGGPPRAHGHVGGRPLVVGLLFTGLNPYFLLWWVGVAWPMVSGAARLMPLGYVVMYLSHVWYDYLWLGVMSLAGERGARLLSGAGYKALLYSMVLLLLLFAADTVSAQLFNTKLLPL